MSYTGYEKFLDEELLKFIPDDSPLMIELGRRLASKLDELEAFAKRRAVPKPVR